jgi:hypothetical protein
LSLGSAGFDAERSSQPLPGRAEAARRGGSGGSGVHETLATPDADGGRAPQVAVAVEGDLLDR